MAPKGPTKTGGVVIVFISQIIYHTNSDFIGDLIASATEIVNSNDIYIYKFINNL